MAENKKISKITLLDGTTYDIKDANASSAITFDGTYDPTTNKAATVSTVTDKINTLDGIISGSAGAGKTLTAFSQTDGKVSATFGNISITKSQISDYPEIEGTITKVTAGTGLSGGGSSGSITLNHSNSVTAKTTQGLYPIKFDAQGHITGSGNAVTELPASDVKAWAKADTKPSYTANEVGAIATTAIGAANGVAPLNASSKIDSTYLPSYVDDVLEYTSKSDFPATGESGKIYVDKSTNLTWRWGGSSYVEISPSIGLGETHSTAFYGDYGKTAYDHASAKGSAFTSGLYKITTNDQGHVTAATAVVKSDITGLGIPGSDTTYSLSGALSSHKFTSTLTPSSGSGTTSEITFVAGSNVTLTDDTINKKITIAATDTTYESKAASSGGTAVSLVTTGEKYTWNNKSDLTLGTTETTAAKGNHVHAITLASDSGTSSITLAGNTKYKLTAGGNSVIFTMPVIPEDTDTHRPIQVNGTEILGDNTTALNLKAGSNITLSNSSGTVTIDATDTNTWRPIGTGATDAAAGNHTHSIDLATDTGTSSITLASAGKYKLTAGGQSVVFTMPTIPDVSGKIDTAGTGLSKSGTTLNHSNSISAGTASEGGSSRTLAFGGTFNIPSVSYDAQGHITSKGSITLTMPANPDTDTDKKTSSSDSSSKLYIIGATTQSSDGQTTYSNSKVYETAGVLTADNYLATLTYSGTPPAATGADSALVNSLYNLGWQDCIV